MKPIRFVLIEVLLLGSALSASTWATSWSIDQTDLWWNPAENGWGIQFVQRGNAIFAVMFVYDPAGNATWYVATLEWVGNPNGVVTWSGDLYAAHGTWFGMVPYNPANFTAAKVGTMTWKKQMGVPGTLTYTVNNVSVTKTITRQPIRNDDYSGTYLISSHLVATACSNPAKNGTTDGSGTLTIVHTNPAIRLTLVAGDINCTLNGTYSQNGQFGDIAGSSSCTNGDVGMFTASDMNVTPFAMVGRLSTSNTTTGCQVTGQIGGVRSDQ